MKSPTIDNFLAFEKKHNCNSIRINDIPVWTLYRYEIHNTIKKYTIGRESGSQTAFKRNELFKMAINALKPLPRKKVDVLFVYNGRRSKNVDTGFYENIFFDEVSKQFNSLLLEHPENHTHMVPNGMDNIFFTDRVAFQTNIYLKLARKFKFRKLVNYTAQVRNTFSPIFKDLESTFGPDLADELTDGLVERMLYFEINKKFCGKILDRTHPKLIMELCYYTMECYAYSALGKERGIPTAEYSHGFSVPSLTPMQFNPEDNSEVLPDHELVFSKIHENIIHLPSNIKKYTIGFPFFEKEREKYKAKYKRDSKTICFISTITEGVQMSKIAADLADAIGDEYHIIYKMHPQEFSIYKQKYPWLLGKNLEIIDNTDNHIYKYLAESQIAISTFSTSTWESVGFGCGTILLDIGDTAFNMQYLINNYNVPLAKNVNDVIDIIKNHKEGYPDPDSIFEPNGMENLCNFIKEYI